MNELTFRISEMCTQPNGWKYEAVPDDYEPGIPIGYGRTIEEAIEDLLESWTMKYDVEVLKFTWR